MLQKFEVGKHYKQGIIRYLEQPRFDFLQSGAILELFFNRPTKQKIEDITRGRFELGFCEKEGIIFMLFRFGSQQFMDAPYTVHLSPKFEFMELAPSTGFGLNVFLVNAATGILKGMRYVGLSTDFSRRFQKAVDRQKQEKFNEFNYNAIINKIYANYSTKDLVNYADAWCKIK